MKKKRRRTVLLILLLCAVALLISLYVYNHEDDWITSKQALHIAVLNADTTEDLVYDVNVTFGTTDDELPVYEVLFTDYTAKYRCVVNAQTGEVLDSTKDLT